MVRSLSRFRLLDEQSRQELLAAFEQAIDRFEIDFGVGEAAALATVARLRKSGRFSHVLVETCRALGESDGDYVLEEQAALVKICRRLGLEPVGAGTFAAARR